MYKNIEIYTEEDLKKYGQAIQTHGDVVLLMIQDLLTIDGYHFPYDLMTVNLYLNNNSGSINVMYRYETGNNIEYNKVFLGVKGLRLQNYSMMTQLERFIDNYCSNVLLSEFVNYPNEDMSSQLNIDELDFVTKYLKGKIIKEIIPEIVEINNITRFHPENVLFYNIMLNQSDKNLIYGTELRQHQEFVNGKPKNILDLLRFVPLDLQCADKTNLTIHDIFRFVKYQYLFIDMRVFQKLLIGATFHPIGMLIANFVYLVSEMIKNDIILQDYKSLKCLCKRIKEILQSYITLHIFREPANMFLISILNHLYVILYWFRGTRPIENDLPDVIIKKLKDFMDNIMIKFNIDSETNVTEQNLMEIYGIILENTDQVDLYVKKLENYADSFHLIYDIQAVQRINIKDFKFFLTPDLIDILCTDNPIDNCNSNYDKCVTSSNINEFDVYDLGNNDGLDVFKTENIENFKNTVFKRKKHVSLNSSIDMKENPRHMVDYFIPSK
ncbi:uncharacterized protein LOC126903368 isoform X2 [Daktulosphaira vitifoliae]|nr:uncharacterized protein LOC126903368 isoform X2 [Daktulosphaira vitifoliae]XP_050537503.1 uncharacterized protein LOC126903368 isoform X2 [Daktulosphaira vitifoliae]XP_050537504.1 uncharacterized protein LOC126903368 isoform X2 [Daktulosphaira vitifoliae]XP_050537505.1 uncharacterized protein LOC126903368 isoform X2 [Daktulosphaira vitifoliae]XP_050537506.1 uncharacterized protein LOC126903368 isoform X2 [Daktulosphaira vitifoliae]